MLGASWSRWYLGMGHTGKSRVWGYTESIDGFLRRTQTCSPGAHAGPAAPLHPLRRRFSSITKGASIRQDLPLSGTRKSQARGLDASAGQAKVDICPKELILSERLWLVLQSLKVVLTPTYFILVGHEWFLDNSLYNEHFVSPPFARLSG